MSTSSLPFTVVIAGAGVAGLEAALALRELAGDRVKVTLLAPDDEFIYRPLRVREPFAGKAAERYAVAEIAEDLGLNLISERFSWLDAGASIVHTDSDRELAYDALLLALGAQLRPAFSHALTIDDRLLDEQLHGLIQDIEGGYLRSIAFIAPAPQPWPLPLYELALMTAQRAYDMGIELQVTIVTPEDAPLALFGGIVSETLARLLAERGIELLASAHPNISSSGQVVIRPGSRAVQVDRVVALPRLFGPSTRGVPRDAEGGFIPIDSHCRVRDLERVFAAGDATDFPVKHGGIAAQQADTAAEAIAALAGSEVRPKPFAPEIRGILLGGPKPLYLSAHISGGHGVNARVSETPTWSPATKISATYLAEYLESRRPQGRDAAAEKAT